VSCSPPNNRCDHSAGPYPQYVEEKAATGVGIQALDIYKPSVISGNSNTPSYLRYAFPAVQCVLPSRYHSHSGD
jgi:hypothetical protein